MARLGAALADQPEGVRRPEEAHVKRYVVLGVFCNLGRVTARREPMLTRILRMNSILSHRPADLRVLAFYGHTGNLIAQSSSLTTDAVGELLSAIDQTTWVAVEVDTLGRAIDTLDAMPFPLPQPGIRWTPGLAFAVTKPEAEAIRSTSRGCFSSLGPTTVAAWKRDCLDSKDRLDRDRRGGGWGALSADLASQTKSRWTARSARTLKGALRLAGSKERGAPN